MKDFGQKSNKELTEHFFRNEYGKMVSVLTRYVGTEHVETAEDIVQETLLRAYDSWQHKGIPENPRAWLYTTAKNLALNSLKRRKYQSRYETDNKSDLSELEELQFSEELIKDEQLRMMCVCCHTSISESSQIALILKILCGLSIAEIASAFFSTHETINKRLVRGRKQLRENEIRFETVQDFDSTLPTVLKTVYLLFNEGYSPSHKDEIVRYELCLEAIRLAQLIVSSDLIKDKSDCYALLALMYLNASRFESRVNEDNEIIELERQNRSKWNQYFISQGTHYLQQAVAGGKGSRYLILATISANHCIAESFEKTNWPEILSMYDNLIALEDSPIARLNRAVVVAKVREPEAAIKELLDLESRSDITEYYLFHATLGELYNQQKDSENAIFSFKKAILLTNNERDKKLLQKKLMNVVPIL